MVIFILDYFLNPIKGIENVINMILLGEDGVGNIFWCMETNILELLKTLVSVFDVYFCMAVIGCNVYT